MFIRFVCVLCSGELAVSNKKTQKNVDAGEKTCDAGASIRLPRPAKQTIAPIENTRTRALRRSRMCARGVFIYRRSAGNKYISRKTVYHYYERVCVCGCVSAGQIREIHSAYRAAQIRICPRARRPTAPSVAKTRTCAHAATCVCMCVCVRARANCLEIVIPNRSARIFYNIIRGRARLCFPHALALDARHAAREGRAMIICTRYHRHTTPHAVAANTTSTTAAAFVATTTTGLSSPRACGCVFVCVCAPILPFLPQICEELFTNFRAHTRTLARASCICSVRQCVCVPELVCVYGSAGERATSKIFTSDIVFLGARGRTHARTRSREHIHAARIEFLYILLSGNSIYASQMCNLTRKRANAHARVPRVGSGPHLGSQVRASDAESRLACTRLLRGGRRSRNACAACAAVPVISSN